MFGRQILSPGGCWYCETREKPLVFSMEFDTYLHLDCLKVRLSQDPNDVEARIMAQEIDPSLLPPEDIATTPTKPTSSS